MRIDFVRIFVNLRLVRLFSFKFHKFVGRALEFYVFLEGTGLAGDSGGGGWEVEEFGVPLLFLTNSTLLLRTLRLTPTTAIRVHVIFLWRRLVRNVLREVVTWFEVNGFSGGIREVFLAADFVVINFIVVTFQVKPLHLIILYILNLKPLIDVPGVITFVAKVLCWFLQFNSFLG